MFMLCSWNSRVVYKARNANAMLRNEKKNCASLSKIERIFMSANVGKESKND